MAMLTYFIGGLITLLIYFYISRKRSITLPGPWGLPLLGNVLQIKPRFYQIFQDWSRKYGEMYTVKLGKDRCIVISDPKLGKELFSLDATTGSMSVPETALFESEPHIGLVNSKREHWEQLRRFTLRQLRDFGFGKSSMEALIMEEVNEFNETLRSSQGAPITNIKRQFSLAVVNSLWMIVSGERYSHNDPKLSGLVRQLKESVNEIGKSGGIILFAPWAKHIIPEISGYNAIRKVLDGVVNFLSETIASHKATYPEDDSPRDFIDAFLKETRLAKDPKSAFYKDVGEKQLINSISDLFIAGSDTTSTTLVWAFMYLCKWPEVQKKFQEEIKSVAGNSRPVSVSDRPNMPYTLGLIEEILRLSSISALGLPHRTIADLEFRGVNIPKDTLLFINAYYIHHNPEIWGDPDELRPERHLTDGKMFKRNENMVPFLVGRRVCLGETLARDTIFLFLTNTFQHWSISFNPTAPEPSLLPVVGLGMNPEPYEIVIAKVE